MPRVEVLHPDPSKNSTRIDVGMYEDVRSAILSSLRAHQPLLFGELKDHVEANTPDGYWSTASVGWYTTTVKLDLEARGIIARHGTPQELTLTELGERIVG